MPLLCTFWLVFVLPKTHIYFVLPGSSMFLQHLTPVCAFGNNPNGLNLQTEWLKWSRSSDRSAETGLDLQIDRLKRF